MLKEETRADFNLGVDIFLEVPYYRDIMNTTTPATTDTAMPTTPTTREYVSPAESARLIRAELKTRYGWTSRQVSVKSDSFSLGSSIDITIKAPGIPVKVVEEVANGQERIHRCKHTGEILGGANRYVSVSLDWELVRREGLKLVAWVEETPIHPSQLRIVEVCGERYYIGRTHETHGYSVRSANSGFIPSGQSAGAVADFFATQMIQAGIEVVPPADPEEDGPEPAEEETQMTNQTETTETTYAKRQRIVGRTHFGTATFAPAVEIRWEDSGANLWKCHTDFELSPRDPKGEDAALGLFLEVLQTIEHKPRTSFLRKSADPFYEPNDVIDRGKDFGLFNEDFRYNTTGSEPPEAAIDKAKIPPIPTTTKEERRTTSHLLDSVKEADQDFEWYPTTRKMVEAVSRHLDTSSSCSILDIGAGDGRVLKQLSSRFKTPEYVKLYAIEKSTVLIQAQPEDIIPVGTDLFEQNLTALPVDYVFCNPPYSQFETWACMIIESGYARRAFLILPQRWKESEEIKIALKKRGASARVIHSDDFLDAPRKARAVVDIVEISYPKDKWDQKPADPFDSWFDQNISTFDQEPDDNWEVEQRAKETELARIHGLDSITSMVEAYNEEYARMETNYRAIFGLDYTLLWELGVNKDNVREGLKKKMSGLKSKYWQVLFDRLDAITNRLSAKTKAEFLDKLLGQTVLAFTEGNAYSVVIWAIKNANQYFDRQTVDLFLELSTFDGVFNYVSNIRTWKQADWRFSRRHYDDEGYKPTHYGLDYRIVLDRFSAIGGGYEYPSGLAKHCHDTVNDILAVLFNLGFPASGARSLDREWIAGEWQNWYRLGNRNEILFQVKAHAKGTLHFRFAENAIKALNVEAGRLLGWLKDPGDVVEELGYTFEEAGKWFGCTKAISTGEGRKLLGAGNPETGRETAE